MSISPEALAALAANPPSDPSTRSALHTAARALVHATETASDVETRIHASFTVLPIVKIATDLDLFNILVSTNSNTGQPVWHVDDLAQRTGAEASLLHRILRFLATQALVAEVGEAAYGASRLTPFLQPSGFAAGVKHNHNWPLRVFTELPNWLTQNGYRSPTSSTDGPFPQALNADLDVMAWLAANPEQAAATFEYMAWQKIRGRSWMDDGGVDVAKAWRLSKQEVVEGRVLMVDVGGGGGHQCFEFRRSFPERKGRLVVQDLEVMTSQIDSSAAAAAGVEAMTHDFLTPQPVKGAKVYYLRTVLHDWNDEKAERILRPLRDVMARDSVVVIDEMVVPAQGATERTMLYDMAMLACLGAQERSERQWKDVLERSGLRLKEVDVYDAEAGIGLIVAERAD